jgi:arginase
MAAPKIAVFGVPASAGTLRAGVERGPFALREAGLLAALRATGARVVNLSDLSLFPYRDDPEHPRARNVEGVACAVRTTADETTRALAEGFTVVLGGDCTLAAGVAGGAGKALGRPVGLVTIDANADLNTPETTGSGLVAGMAVALAMGDGPPEIASAVGVPVRPEHVAVLAFRDLDPGERARLDQLALALPAVAARRLGMRATAALALDAIENGDGPVVVHLDVDAIDPSEMPAKDLLTPGPGLSLAEVSDLVTALVASPRTAALFVAGYLPDADADGSRARALVELIARAVARRVRD